MAFDKDVPVAANQISADLAAINANWEYVIHGDGTGGTVMRIMHIFIEEGTNADTIKCTPSNVWNATTTPGTTDNITKDGNPTSNYTLAANGSTLTILAAGLDGNAVAVISTSVWNNSSTVGADVRSQVTSSNIVLSFYKHSDGSTIDIEEDFVEAAKSLYVEITYITSA